MAQKKSPKKKSGARKKTDKSSQNPLRFIDKPVSVAQEMEEKAVVSLPRMTRRKKSGTESFLVSGNEACVEGALAAGLGFFAGYPITPATEIAEYLSARLPAVGGTFIQMEDEIASMAAIIGASIAGRKSMTATSGPGFSLMQENIGYAIMAEIPCVIVNVMRGGPSTGLPTSPSQGDVMQTRWGTHGEHNIIVLCPHSVTETYELTIKAFNFSEKYRTPVILLMDEVVGHMREKIQLPPEKGVPVMNRLRPTVPPEWYAPYEDTPSRVPAMAAFGDGYRYHITGLVHDTQGFPTGKTAEIQALMSRLSEKITKNRKDIVMVDNDFMDDAEVAVVAYGSVARSARRAVVLARNGGVKAGLVRPVTLWPFPQLAINRLAERMEAIIIPEMNLGQYLREVERHAHGGCRIVPVSCVDGTLHTPEVILRTILQEV